MTSRLPLSVLMRNLERELEGMAGQCESLAEAARFAAASPLGDDRDRTLIALQRIDGLTQSLRDLARLAGAVRQDHLGEMTVDSSVIRQTLRLVSLSDRLLGQSDAGRRDDEPDLFL